MAIGRDGIGLELASAVPVGCVLVTELTCAIPGMRFPVDVSGGVARFRHRRGELQRLQIEISARSLERWAAPRLRGLVGTQWPEMWVGVEPQRATVCLKSPSEAHEKEQPLSPICVFDVHAIAEGEDLVLVVCNARGANLPSTATAIAIDCVGAVLEGRAERRGAEFRLRRAAAALVRVLLPQAGARVPATDEVRWMAIASHGDNWILHAAHGALDAAPTEAAVRAREVAAMLVDADDDLVRGDLDRAREKYIGALERAPGHPEVGRRIAEIDARVPGRAEAALATLAASRERDGDTRSGVITGELLAYTGDVQGAVASLERAGETEPAPALAARAYELAASLVPNPEDAARWLDRALVRAPQATTARWGRVRARLALGRLEHAQADVEHLEALARGKNAKHLVWMHAGNAWQAAGLAGHAASIFERALHYAPDEPYALAGLGAALVHEGRHGRGLALLARAVEIAQARAEPASRIVLELAQTLAERLDDLPAAIARVSAIPSDAREAPAARGLEGRWRARLGDLVGAGLAFARLRDLAASFPSSDAVPRDALVASEDPRIDAIVAMLREAAEMERQKRGDLLAAQRHLGVALRLRPHHGEARRAYREVGAALARRPDDECAEVEHEDDKAEERRPVLNLGPCDESPASPQDAERAARVDELTRRLHADPHDDAIADELASLLEALGRGHELLALLSARLEDADAARRAELAPRAASTLERLASQAADAGRAGEAALYRDTIAALIGRSC